MEKNMDINEDVGDARGISWRPRHEPREVSLNLAPDSEQYYMSHGKRGKCLIFNNKDFQRHTNLNVRNGTEADGAALHRCFRGLDFDVVIHHNYGARQIVKTLEEAAKEDHTDRDCFVCCILTHGDQGVLFGNDGKFLTDQVFEPFRGDVCTTLVGKPKLFFIQACQGDRLDKGVLLKHKQSADSETVCKIPTQADFLISYSTVPGFYSWRNTSQGSWFIQALCEVLESHSSTTHLQDMMTLVCRKVAYDFQSCVPSNPDMDQMKQIPCITSTLTRKIFFSLKF